MPGEATAMSRVYVLQVVYPTSLGWGDVAVGIPILDEIVGMARLAELRTRAESVPEDNRPRYRLVERTIVDREL